MEDMLKRSGGDAKAAFYMAAKEKGVDPNAIIKQVSSIRDPKAAMQSMFANNPMMQQLSSIFSMIK